MNEIISFSEELFRGNYVYTEDTVEESYDYMSGEPMRGDCDDYVITLFENLLKNGMLDHGQAKWHFGYYGDTRHAWFLITIEDETFLFDSGYNFGIPYHNVKSNYQEEFIVYRY